MTVCSVDNCADTATAKGMCSSHYNKCKRYGSPIGGEVKRSAVQNFLRAAVSFSGDECLLWIGGKSASGYPSAIRLNGVNLPRMAAHRLVLAASKGVLHFGRRMQAAHSCGNRLCCNPSHLRWATPVENSQDKRLHKTFLFGDKHPNAKITTATARVIKKMKSDGLGVGEIAQKTNVPKHTVSDVCTGKSWVHA